jgi:hypothetical protein
MRSSTAGFTLAPPELDAVLLGPRQPGVDAFADDAAFELGEHAQHLKHCPARRGRRVETLLTQEQIDALIVKALEDADSLTYLRTIFHLARRPHSAGISVCLDERSDLSFDFGLNASALVDVDMGNTRVFSNIDIR